MAELEAKKPSDGNLQPLIGAVFTPAEWAEWIIQKYEIAQQWLQGAVIFEPTAGHGVFLERLIYLTASQGITITTEMLSRLWANEIQPSFKQEFLYTIKKCYSLDFPKSNFCSQDILYFDTPLQADILLGNPPWLNFCDLPSDYKQQIKPLFHQYGLVNNTRDLLLGSSRIEFAALIIAKTLKDFLKPYGKAYYLMPLSVFFNEGASVGFRSYQIDTVDFCVEAIFDLKGWGVFKEIKTKYGLVEFQRDRPQHFPIPYSIGQTEGWQSYLAQPLFARNDPLTVYSSDREVEQLKEITKVKIPTSSKPRQGVNSCGAKDIFVFEPVEIAEQNFKVSNKYGQQLSIPREFLFPLITKSNFAEIEYKPQKYILLPYNRETGKPMAESDLKQHEELWQYLYSYCSTLQNRKGSLIQSWIRKGYWYALLGVGVYTFSPYKVVWQAYGQKEFRAKLFSGEWQGNQALHAFIPVNTKAEGEVLVEWLNNSIVERYLRSQQIAGTCNWAQPSRIAKLLAQVQS